MKRFTIIIGLGLGLGLLFLLVAGMVSAGEPAGTETTPALINTGRQAEWSILKTEHQAIFGPHICVAFGDPFSSFGDPLASQFRETWRGDAIDRTYHYVIKIPPVYLDDVVRVELFDPDSKNQPNNNGGSYTANVAHTVRAIEEGLPAFELLSCTANQKDPCLIDTNEDTLGLDQDIINLWWFARVDENRGTGTPPGDPAACGAPASYTVGYNTITLYELFYYRQEADGNIVRTELAYYFGQSGDAGRDGSIANDSTDHVTDLRWVAPGGQPIFDQPALVPTECGSPNGGDFHPVDCPGGTLPGAGNGFEVELEDDLPEILVDAEGNRYVYLDVTSISGASENGYDIWAGPDDYVTTVSSDVNIRNVHAHNNPQSHHAGGVELFARHQNPLNSNFDDRYDIPLTYLGPEYAGQSVYISHYDSDAGSQPPLPFIMDTIAPEDWSLVFAAGDPDPDGVSGRCVPGSCNSQFVTPTYRIDLPDLTEACTDPSDPAQANVCTPFYGGNLIAQHNGGQFDTYLWHVEVPETPFMDPTEGCTAFPIAPEIGVRTLTEPEYTAILGQFTYPTGTNIPDWRDFWEQPPLGETASLLEGREGFIYKLDFGSQPRGFQWLKWNTNITGISGGGNILATSLEWPGNSWDYFDHGDPPQPAPPPFEYTFRGFAEAGDSADRAMHLNDRIAIDAVSGGFGGSGVQGVLNDHIDTGRALRLPLWDVDAPQDPGTIKTDHYGIFRIIGYSASHNWLILEFVRLDESCGQLETEPVPVSAVTLSGPLAGVTDQTYHFTATVTPVNVSLPVTTTWQATGQAPVTIVGDRITHVQYSWPVPGLKTITVTAHNAVGGPVTNTMQVDILQPPAGIALDGPEFGETQQTLHFTATVTPADVSLPVTTTWEATGQSPIIVVGDRISHAQFSWPDPGMKTITVTAHNEAGGPLTATMQIEVIQLPGKVMLSGPITAEINSSTVFTAMVTPLTTTQPLTYVWSLNGVAVVTHTAGLSDTLTFIWYTAGTFQITVAVFNLPEYPVSTTHEIEILVPPEPDLHLTWLPIMIQEPE